MDKIPALSLDQARLKSSIIRDAAGEVVTENLKRNDSDDNQASSPPATRLHRGYF